MRGASFTDTCGPMWALAMAFREAESVTVEMASERKERFELPEVLEPLVVLELLELTLQSFDSPLLLRPNWESDDKRLGLLSVSWRLLSAESSSMERKAFPWDAR